MPNPDASGVVAGGYSVQHEGDVCRVAGSMDFQSAGPILESVRPLIEKTKSLTIDLAGITDSNSAGLALMIEWLSLARKSGHQVSFEAVPEGLSQLAGVCQVDGLI